MMVLFWIGILLFAWRLMVFAFHAAWSITKCVLFTVGVPLILIALFFAGMVYLAVPLLAIGPGVLPGAQNVLRQHRTIARCCHTKRGIPFGVPLFA